MNNNMARILGSVNRLDADAVTRRVGKLECEG